MQGPEPISALTYIGGIPLTVAILLSTALLGISLLAFRQRQHPQKLRLYFGASNMLAIAAVIYCCFTVVMSVAFSDFYACASDTPTRLIVHHIILENAYTVLLYLAVISFAFTLSSTVWIYQLLKKPEIL